MRRIEVSLSSGGITVCPLSSITWYGAGCDTPAYSEAVNRLYTVPAIHPLLYGTSTRSPTWKRSEISVAPAAAVGVFGRPSIGPPANPERKPAAVAPPAVGAAADVGTPPPPPSRSAAAEPVLPANGGAFAAATGAVAVGAPPEAMPRSASAAVEPVFAGIDSEAGGAPPTPSRPPAPWPPPPAASAPAAAAARRGRCRRGAR